MWRARSEVGNGSRVLRVVGLGCLGRLEGLQKNVAQYVGCIREHGRRDGSGSCVACVFYMGRRYEFVRLDTATISKAHSVVLGHDHDGRVSVRRRRHVLDRR